MENFGKLILRSIEGFSLGTTVGTVAVVIDDKIKDNCPTWLRITTYILNVIGLTSLTIKILNRINED